MTNQLPFDMVLPVEVIRRWATEYKEAGYAPEAVLEYVAWEAAHWGGMNASGNPVRVIHRTPEPEGPDKVYPFVVRHYTDDERPSIKGNGFDGLEIGEDRQDAEEFIAWINKHIRPTAEPNAQ